MHSAAGRGWREACTKASHDTTHPIVLDSRCGQRVVPDVVAGDARFSDQDHPRQEQVHPRAGRADRSGSGGRGSQAAPPSRRRSSRGLGGQVGQRLVAAIPAEFAHREFRYTFEVVNQKEINAFALPGGPMFLESRDDRSRQDGGRGGWRDGARDLARGAAARHGPGHQGREVPDWRVLGQIAGAVVGGTLGGVIAQGSQIGLGTYFLKFGREAESQADLLGAQILARAGYDPRQMANMFKTIEAAGRQPRARVHEQPSEPGQPLQRDQQGGGQSARAGQRRYRPVHIGETAAGRHVAGADGRADCGQPEETGQGAATPAANRRTVNVELPAARERTYQPGNSCVSRVPANWQSRRAARC